jgi:DNA-binding GntR family transcriptional regulator
MDVLRRDIYEGSLPSGTPLREVALADRFGVGRYTVRSALSHLAADGLVEQIPHIGARVRRLTAADVEDMFQVRQALELTALGVIVRDELPLNSAREAAERLERLERSDLSKPSVRRRTLDADLGFHKSIVETAGSPRMLRAYTTVQAELRLALTQLIATAEVFPGEHWGLVRALEDRDLSRARRWVDQHLATGVGDILRALELQSP